MLPHHIKDENVNLSSPATSVLLKFGTLHLLENYSSSAYPQNLYFQLLFIKVHCTGDVKNAIKGTLKKKWFSVKWQIDYFETEKRKYYDDLEKKRQARKKKYDNNKESIKQYKKKKMWKI